MNEPTYYNCAQHGVTDISDNLLCPRCLAAERETLHIGIDVARSARDNAVTERDQARSERDAAYGVRDGKRDQMRTERDQMRTERDQARSERVDRYHIATTRATLKRVIKERDEHVVSIGKLATENDRLRLVINGERARAEGWMLANERLESDWETEVTQLKDELRNARVSIDKLRTALSAVWWESASNTPKADIDNDYDGGNDGFEEGKEYTFNIAFEE